VSDSLLTRRKLLVGLGASALACDAQAPRTGLLGRMDRLNQHTQMALFRPGKTARAPSARAQTPGDAFPTYFISPSVPLPPAGWTLKVGGAVQRPLQLDLSALMRLPRTDVRVRHHCVEGWSAVASWHGVAVAELAARAGADPRAGYVEFRSFDRGYWSSWDRGSAFHAQTIVAYGKDGAPLAPGHGAPLRLYAAVKLGYKMVKYLTEVNFLPAPTGGYWEDQGYEWFAGV
jgi:DMSO/TMAO reductase YedYZ molybdopterin-dependent catalytic subunit